MSNSQAQNPQKTDIFVCSRFKEERERKRISQMQVASELGVTSKTVGRWEKEIPIPSDKLGLLQQLGFDVVFILTGERTLGLMIQADIVGAQNEIKRFQDSVSQSLAVGESERTVEYLDNTSVNRLEKLVEGFSQADEAGKLAVEAMINALLVNKQTEK